MGASDEREPNGGLLRIAWSVPAPGGDEPEPLNVDYEELETKTLAAVASGIQIAIGLPDSPGGRTSWGVAPPVVDAIRARVWRDRFIATYPEFAQYIRAIQEKPPEFTKAVAFRGEQILNNASIDPSVFARTVPAPAKGKMQAFYDEHRDHGQAGPQRCAKLHLYNVLRCHRCGVAFKWTDEEAKASPSDHTIDGKAV